MRRKTPRSRALRSRGGQALHTVRYTQRRSAGAPPGSALPHEDHASNLVGPVRDEKGLLGRSRPLGSFDENGRRVRRARSRKTSEPRGRVGHSRRARRHRQGRSRRARMGGSNCSESRWAKPSLITVCRAGRWFAQARRLGPDEEVRKQWISHEMNDVALDVSQALARKSV